MVSSNAAATYDAKPWQQAVVKQLTGEIRSHLDWIGVPSVKAGGEPAASSSTKSREVRLLDFACGPGTASWERLT